VLSVAAAAALVVAAVPPVAGGSELIDHNAKQVKLAVSRDGRALLTYRADGVAKRVLVWGAVNALAPTTSRPQVKFNLDYSADAAAFANACRPYDGPELAWLVTACRAPDGSYWAVQNWQRGLPNWGVTPTAKQAAWELRISHWTGPIAQLDVGLDWVYSGRFHSIFGRFTYRGQPVHGFRSTRAGVPLDTYGRNLYLDTYNSAYGAGWHRENSFLAHNPTGAFCYGFYPFRATAGSTGEKLRGNGARYRMTVIGPGVTPDVQWEGEGLPDFNAANPEHVAREREMNALRGKLAAGDRLCQQN
jgi:hypothetical protein